MSQENVEIVRHIYEAWNAGDLGLEHFARNIELHQTSRLPGTSIVFRGHDGLLKAVQELFGGLRDLSWKPDEFVAAPNDRVVVPFRFHAIGRNSGVTVDMSLIHVWTLRNELAIRCDTYEDSAKALEAAGLRE
jgi:ketosteroid isomerase-like protein